MAREAGCDLYALTIRYGQRHEREIDAARAVARALGVTAHSDAGRRPGVARRVGAARDGEVPKRGEPDPSIIPATYVPARNTVFLALALAWAEVARRVRHRTSASTPLDYSGYPDCRPEFIDGVRAARRPGDEGRGRGGAVPDPGAAHRPVEGRDHPRGAVARPRLRADAQLLRSGPGRAPVRPLRQLRAPRARVRRGGRARSVDAAEVTRCLPPRPSASTTPTPTGPSSTRSCCATIPQEGRWIVVLDRTAFYPASGGQPFDTGTLGRRPRRRGDGPGGRRDRAPGRPRPAGRADGARARSTGRAGSITCSSTPASTCCRRCSTACMARARSASISEPDPRRSISTAIWPPT